VELHTAEPMIDVRLLSDKLFGVSNVVQLTSNAALMGTFFLLPLFLQAEKGLSPFDVGLVTFPMALGVATMAQPAAKLYPKIGPRKMMIAGFTGSALMTFALALVDYDTSNWWLVANMYVRGMFFGLIIIPIQAATFATIRPEDTGRASSIFNTGRQVAASLGVAVIATTLANRMTHYGAALGDPTTNLQALSAFQDSFIFAGILSVGGIIACLWIDDAKATAATQAEPVMAH
jgi:MFS family permease